MQLQVHVHTPNKLNFDKYKRCTLCGASGIYLKCIARKYTTYISETETDVFHYRAHSCEAKIQSSVVINVVSEAIRIDPSIKPSTIQENVVISAMKSGKPWNDVKKAAKKVVNRSISNEDHKQKQHLLPHGYVM